MGELNMSVPSVRRSMETSLGANVSGFVDIEMISRMLETRSHAQQAVHSCQGRAPAARRPDSREVARN